MSANAETNETPRPRRHGNWRFLAAAVTTILVVGSVTALLAAKFGPGTGTAPVQAQSAARSQTLVPDGSFRGGPPRGLRGGDVLSAAADYLGLSARDLVARLQTGETLASIAQATDGKSVDGLVDAMVVGETQQLADAVADGQLTQEQADGIAADVRARIQALVEGGFAGPRGDDGPGDGPRFPGMTL